MSQADVEETVEHAISAWQLPPADAELLAAAAHVKECRPGTEFISMEMAGEAVFFIVEGTVRIEALDESGAIVILAYLGAGDIVGEMCLLDDTPRSASAVAVDRCRLVWVHRSAFEELVTSSPPFCRRLLTVMARRLRLADARVVVLATKDVRARVALQLLSFASSYGEESDAGSVRIRLRLPQQDIADYVGASRTSVNQALVSMRSRGLIAIDAEQLITILDPAALARSCR